MQGISETAENAAIIFVKIGEKKEQLQVTGQCARCSMVDIDPDSCMKGKTLQALSEYRRNNGQITFGIFLKKMHDGQEEVVIQVGDTLTSL